MTSFSHKHYAEIARLLGQFSVENCMSAEETEQLSRAFVKFFVHDNPTGFDPDRFLARVKRFKASAKS